MVRLAIGLYFLCVYLLAAYGLGNRIRGGASVADLCFVGQDRSGRSDARRVPDGPEQGAVTMTPAVICRLTICVRFSILDSLKTRYEKVDLAIDQTAVPG